MAKLDLRIVLIDESIVDYGFRVLMSGYQGEQFEKNPVLLLQHKRVDDGYQALNDDAVLPLGKWNNIQIEGSQLLASPEFDDDDPFALRVQKKTEKGYYNAASIWIEPIEVSDDETLKLPGQYGPTVTKWGIREASIVDIPNCRNSLAIRNSAGKRITLSGNHAQPEVLDYLKTLLPKNKLQMDKKLLAAKLGLDENTADDVLANKLGAVITDASKLAGVVAENTRLQARVVELTNAAETKKHEDLVDGAITAKKLAAGDRDKYLKLAKADFDTTKEIIDGMKAYESIEDKLKGGQGGNGAELSELIKLSGKELYMDGKLERFKEIAPLDQFKLKYKEAFGIEYQA